MHAAARGGTVNDDDRTDWRQAMLTMALEEHFGRRPPDVAADLLRRAPALRTATPAPAVRSRQPSRPTSRLAAAALVALGAGAVFAVAFAKGAATPAQGREEPLLPLEPGAEWVYDVVRDGAKTQVTRRAMASTPVADRDDAAAMHQVFVRDGEASGFEYWSADAKGLWRHPGTRGLELPDHEGGAAVTRVVALPLGAETRWETVGQQLRVADRVVRGGAVGGRSKRVVQTMRCELVDPAAAVEVPGGRFVAVHVRLSPDPQAENASPQVQDGRQEDPDRTVEDLWFARGTGLVKRTVQLGGKSVETAELRSFTKGRAEVPAQQALATFLAKDAGVTNLGPVQATAWIEPASRELLLRSRFCVVTFVDRKVAYRVFGGAVTEFDPEDLEQWDAVVRDEELTQWNEALLPQLRCTTLADLALRLHGVHRGLRCSETDSRFVSVRIDASGAACTRMLKAKAADGTDRTITLDFAVGSDDQVRRLEFRE
jgi:hypothetical protein